MAVPVVLVAACAATASVGARPATAVGEATAIHVVYSFAGAAYLACAIRSMVSAVHSASPTTAERLRLHVFSDEGTLTPQRLVRLRAFFGERRLCVYTGAFADVTANRTVWEGRAALRHPSNYFRFYVPALFARLGIPRFLYLDVDSLVVGDVGPLYDRAFARTQYAVASAVQSTSHCKLHKVVSLDQPQLKHLHRWKGEPCLDAGVLLVEVQRWLDADLTARVESLLAENARAQLWGMGSFPPLVIALENHRWEKLRRRAAVDMKAPRAKGGDVPWETAVLLHPVKALGVLRPAIANRTHLAFLRNSSSFDPLPNTQYDLGRTAGVAHSATATALPSAAEAAPARVGVWATSRETRRPDGGIGVVGSSIRRSRGVRNDSMSIAGVAAQPLQLAGLGLALREVIRC